MNKSDREKLAELLEWLVREQARVINSPSYDDESYYRNQGSDGTLDEVRSKVKELFGE